MINLIMRFYDVDFGKVLIDGVDVRAYNVAQLRERMGLVMQEPTLFNYTIKENVLYGKMDASNKEIKEQIAKIDERGKLNMQEKINLEKSLKDEVKMLNEQVDEALNDAE